MAVVRLENIHKIYDMGQVKVRALRGIDLTIEEGEMLAVMGPSGAGKSTLMHIAGCLDRPTEGRYLLQGQNVAQKTDDELARLRNQFLGFVFQEFNLLASMTALENVMLPLTYRNTSDADRRSAAEEALKRVGLGERMDHRPNQLSGGQKQRVAIARTLAAKPSLLIADEPTGNVDSKTQRGIMEFLAELNSEQGITIMVVTHDLAVAQHTERLVSLHDGRIIGDDHPSNLDGVRVSDSYEC